MKRSAFTMIELIFVIIIMGILAKFGVELFQQTYEGYARSLYINELQSKSASAVQTLANRLTYRIKDSINSTSITINTVTWTGMDIDGWRNNAWSGIIDLDASNAAVLSSPNTPAAAGVKQIYFIGSDINSSGQPPLYNVTMGTGTLTPDPLSTFSFSNIEVYEYYQVTDGQHTVLRNGTQLLLDGQLLTDDVGALTEDFLVEKLGDGIHIHLCLEKAANPLLQGKVCKDKFVF